MEYINTEDFCLEHTCVTLGKFDGIHLGHRLLLQQLAEGKKGGGVKSVVFTFDFPPGTSFSGKGGRVIYTAREKKEILEGLGIDVLVAYPFTKETREMEAEEFIRRILVQKLGAEMVAVGSDNRFGHNRRGDVAMLKDFSIRCGFRSVVCGKVRDQEGVVSSTRIRGEIETGNIEKANRLLGAPYHVSGEISSFMPGGGTGPAITMLLPDEKLLPPTGLYETRTVLPYGALRGVTEITGPAGGGPGGTWIKTFFTDGKGGSMAGGMEKPEGLANRKGTDIVKTEFFLKKS